MIQRHRGLTKGGRLAVFIPNMGAGGIQVANALLVGGLVERGWIVDLVLANGSGPFSRAIDDRVRVVDLAAKRLGAAMVPLSRYLREASPDAIIAGPDTAAAVARASCVLGRVPCPVIAVVHTSIGRRTALSAGSKQRLVRLLAKQLLKRSPAVVAVSSGVGRELHEGFGVPAEVLSVIPNPLDVSAISDTSTERVSHPFLDSMDLPVLVAAGRLSVEKGYPMLLRAFAEALKTRDMRLIILGEGKERSRLESLAMQLGISDKVDLVGHVMNPYPYIAAAEIFVHSAIYEGAGIVLAEALACGTQVISTDCPEGPAEILGYGRFGRLVPVGDHEQMADAILQVLSGEITFEKADAALDVYAVRNVVVQYERVIDRLAPRAR